MRLKPAKSIYHETGKVKVSLGVFEKPPQVFTPDNEQVRFEGLGWPNTPNHLDMRNSGQVL